RERHFRDDLFYRLNVLPLHVPPLRERQDDIIPLSLFYLKKFNTQYNVKAVFSPEALAALEALDWPGNVRELRNMIERLVVTGGASVLRAADIALFSSRPAQPVMTRQAGLPASTDIQPEPGGQAEGVAVRGLMPLEEAVASVERQLLEKAKREGRSCRKMAALLGVSYSTIARKLQQYNL
ncbi:hypothetical protein LJC23_06390, partial [Desulfovibrio sp. OttesenSCG-928-I05]|nr:hypothetical protein [Desulfovibrio sp. OttesenSCG-928-I05]